MSEPLSVDVSALRGGGVDIDRLAESTALLRDRLTAALARYRNAGGHGDQFAELIQKQHTEPAAAVVQVLEMLAALLRVDGDGVLRLSEVLDTANQNATDSAQHGGRRS